MSNGMFEKASHLNETLLEQLGKAAEMQMNAFQRYSEMALSQAKKASEVRDLDGLKSLVSGQSETLKALHEQFTADMKAWQDYSGEAREKVQKAFASADTSAAQKGKAGAQKG
ncbi:MAG: phasin family protein [Marinobacter sp.]